MQIGGLSRSHRGSTATATATYRSKETWHEGEFQLRAIVDDAAAIQNRVTSATATGAAAPTPTSISAGVSGITMRCSAVNRNGGGSRLTFPTFGTTIASCHRLTPILISVAPPSPHTAAAAPTTCCMRQHWVQLMCSPRRSAKKRSLQVRVSGRRRYLWWDLEGRRVRCTPCKHAFQGNRLSDAACTSTGAHCGRVGRRLNAPRWRRDSST